MLLLIILFVLVAFHAGARAGWSNVEPAPKSAQHAENAHADASQTAFLHAHPGAHEPL